MLFLNNMMPCLLLALSMIAHDSTHTRVFPTLVALPTKQT